MVFADQIHDSMRQTIGASRPVSGGNRSARPVAPCSWRATALNWVARRGLNQARHRRSPVAGSFLPRVVLHLAVIRLQLGATETTRRWYGIN